MNSPQLAEATKVIASCYSAFLVIPIAKQEICNAVVPVAHATAYFAPTKFANFQN